MYVDANVFVLAVLDAGSKGKQALEVLERIEKGRKATTSVLVLDEVMWALIKNGQKNLVGDVIEDIYGLENLTVKEVPQSVPLSAICFIDENNLRPRDAFHTAIMEHFGIKEIVTDDKDFDKIPGIKRIKI